MRIKNEEDYKISKTELRKIAWKQKCHIGVIIEMNHKIGDTIELFQTKETRKVRKIVEGVQADIYGTMISAYELEGESKLFVDIYDGTVASI